MPLNTKIWMELDRLKVKGIIRVTNLHPTLDHAGKHIPLFYSSRKLQSSMVRTKGTLNSGPPGTSVAETTMLKAEVLCKSPQKTY